MPTIELRGMHETGFRLVERDFSGGVEVDYTPRGRITDEEAAALIAVGYLSPSGVNEPRPDPNLPPIDPRTLLSIQQLHLCDDVFVNQLIITLTANPDLKRAETTITDPWYDSQMIDKAEWIKQIRFQTTTEDCFTIVEEWPDNPAEATAFW